jgi:hypothetical protein
MKEINGLMLSEHELTQREKTELIKHFQKVFEHSVEAFQLINRREAESDRFKKTLEELKSIYEKHNNCFIKDSTLRNIPTLLEGCIHFSKSQLTKFKLEKIQPALEKLAMLKSDRANGFD